MRTFHPGLRGLEAEKRVAEQRVLELQAADANRQPLLAEIETLKQRLRKTDAEIAETNRQIGRDESLLAGKKDLADLTERETALAARIEELHRQIREIQGLETSNRETERTVQALDGELRNNMAELERLRVEREELAVVPCRGEGPYASCPKIRRAVEAGQKIPPLEGEVATLSLEVDVQRSSLVQIVTPSSELNRTLEGCERDRRKVDQDRQQYEELRAVEARREERLKGFGPTQSGPGGSWPRNWRGRNLRSPNLLTSTRKMQASRREIENTDRLIISCRRERDSLIARQAQIKQRQEQMEAARTRLAQVEAELGTARTELEDFNYLAKVFGPDEIQLCEIQAAGPQVSTLVNALLEGCFDNKFEIRFRTQRPKADGKGWWTILMSRSAIRIWTARASWTSFRAGSSYWSTKPSTWASPSTTCGRVKAFVTKLCSGTKRWELWMPPTPKSMCACCVGPWTWADSTKSSSSAIRHSFGSWRTRFCQSVTDMSLWKSARGCFWTSFNIPSLASNKGIT